MTTPDKSIFYEAIEILVYKTDCGWMGEMDFTHNKTDYSYAAPAVKTLGECFALLQSFRAEVLCL